MTQFKKKQYFKEGDQGKAICSSCGIVSTIYSHQNILTTDGIQLNSILVAVCDECHSIVSVPQQSAPQIKHQLK